MLRVIPAKMAPTSLGIQEVALTNTATTTVVLKAVAVASAMNTVKVVVPQIAVTPVMATETMIVTA